MALSKTEAKRVAVLLAMDEELDEWIDTFKRLDEAYIGIEGFVACASSKGSESRVEFDSKLYMPKEMALAWVSHLQLGVASELRELGVEI